MLFFGVCFSYTLLNKNSTVFTFGQTVIAINFQKEISFKVNTCLKIMADLITALEDAATSDCQAVVLCGLQSDVLCGLKLADMCKTGVEKENGILSQARYFIFVYF